MTLPDNIQYISERVVNGEEVWMIVPNYPKYAVSTSGRIINYKEIFLNPYLNKGGHRNTGHYLRVSLYNTEGEKKFYVHRIVARAFLGKKVASLLVHHIDHNVMNNNLTNLSLVTTARGKHDDPLWEIWYKEYYLWRNSIPLTAPF